MSTPEEATVMTIDPDGVVAAANRLTEIVTLLGAIAILREGDNTIAPLLLAAHNKAAAARRGLFGEGKT